MRRPAGPLAILVVAVLLALGTIPTLAAGQEGAQGGPEPRASLPDIEDEVMCTICGTLLSLSEAPQAEQERTLIRGWIADGLTKEEIKDRLVVEYGEEVLAVPEGSGFDLTAWIVPALGLALAAVGIALGLRRWRRGTRDRDQAPPEPDLDPAEAERLRSDLARYDL